MTVFERPWRTAAIQYAVVGLILSACAPPVATASSFLDEARQQTLLARPGSRVLAMEGDEAAGLACGWLDPGGAKKTELIRVERGDAGRLNVFTFGTLHGEPGERAKQLYMWAVSKQVCSDVLPAPSGPLAVDAEVDRALERLWDENGPEWAIADVSGNQDYLGLRRRSGGGVIITPTFKTRKDVEGWLAQSGDALAEQENERGRAGAARVDACYASARARNQRVRCNDPAMDQYVVLAPARWQLLKESVGSWSWLIDAGSLSRDGSVHTATTLGLSAEPRPDSSGELFHYAEMSVRMDCDLKQWSETGGSLHKADGTRTETSGPTAPKPVGENLLATTLFKTLCQGDAERTLVSWPDKQQAVQAALVRIRARK